MDSDTAPLRIDVRPNDSFTAAMLAANAVGVMLYLWGASHAWAIPEERAAGIYSVTGEPFVWATFVFPVFALFLLVNGAWLVSLVRRRSEGRVAFLLTSVAWVLAVVVDYAHH